MKANNHIMYNNQSFLNYFARNKKQSESLQIRIKHKKTKLTGLLLFLLLLPIIGLTQEKNKDHDYQKVFDEFNSSIKKDFNSFKSKNDSIFYIFLENSWKTYKLVKDTNPIIPKPIAQPISDTSVKSNKEITPLKKQTLLQDTGKQLIFNGKSPIYHTMSIYNSTPETTNSFDFYGIDIIIPAQNKTVSIVNSITNNDIALYFKNASNNNEVSKTIMALQKSAIENKLNGWGYLELLQSAASSMYSNINNQVLFTWFALLKSGYDTKVGYNDKDIFLMTAFDTPIYCKSYFEENNKKYYLILFKGQKEEQKYITSYKADYPGKLLTLSLRFTKTPDFDTEIKTNDFYYKGQRLRFSYNANLTSFYNTYPQCSLSVFFQAPLSKIAISGLGKFILPHIKNKTDIENVNFILDFIQQAIRYQTDEKQFGKENYLFAEETICYPYADCEDRSIFLSQLLRDYLGLSTIAVVYPNHVALGVNIKENIDGAYVKYMNKKYYIADPTYIGAKLGMVMKNFENIKPEIIIF